MTASHPRGGVSLPADPFLYAIIDASMVGSRSLTQWVDLLGNEDRARVLQWRFKGLSDRAAVDGAMELRAATRQAGVIFVVNDRPDIARIVDADGVHVGQDDMNPADVRTLMPDALIGVSTHNEGQFKRSLASPVDYIAVGPVFNTSSKANPDPVVGLSFVEWAGAQTKTPIVAIGGINAANAGDVIRAGARGVSVISELMKADQPDEVARRMAASLSRPAR